MTNQLKPAWIKVGIGVILHIVVYSTYAQQGPGQWISSAWKDSNYIKLEAMVSFRANHPLTLKWLDKVELRTQTNDFNFKQQEYGVRFYNTNFSEINYRKQTESADIILYQQLADDALHDALVQRYRILSDEYWIEKQMKLIKEQRDLQQKKTQYLESLFQHQLDAELKDLVQAFRKNEKIQLESRVLEEHKKLVTQKMSWTGKDTLLVDGFDWIQPVQIRSLIMNESNTIPVSATFARLLQNKKQAELENTKLQSNQWNLLEFIQARWRNNLNDDLVREKISLGAGIRIPYSGAKRRDQNQVALEKLQINNEILHYASEFHYKTKILKKELESIINQLDDQQIKLQNFEIKFHQPQLLSNPLTRPQDILLIDEIILDWKEELIQLERKIMEKYVDYLAHTRLMSKPPFKNYLQATLGALTN